MKTPRLLPLLLLAAAWSAGAADPGQSEWLTDYKKAQQQARDQKRFLLVDFTGSDWCPPCRLLEKEIFATKEFKEYASKNLVLLEIDFPRRKEQSRELVEQNQKLAMEYNVDAFPSVIILNSEGKTVGGFRGYEPGTSVKQFIDDLKKLPKT